MDITDIGSQSINNENEVKNHETNNMSRETLQPVLFLKSKLHWGRLFLIITRHADSQENDANIEIMGCYIKASGGFNLIPLSKHKQSSFFHLSDEKSEEAMYKAILIYIKAHIVAQLTPTQKNNYLESFELEISNKWDLADIGSKIGTEVLIEMKESTDSEELKIIIQRLLDVP